MKIYFSNHKHHNLICILLFLQFFTILAGCLDHWSNEYYGIECLGSTNTRDEVGSGCSIIFSGNKTVWLPMHIRYTHTYYDNDNHSDQLFGEIQFPPPSSNLLMCAGGGISVDSTGSWGIGPTGAVGFRSDDDRSFPDNFDYSLLLRAFTWLGERDDKFDVGAELSVVAQLWYKF